MTDSQALVPSANVRSSQSQVIDSQSATFPAEGSNSQSQQIPEPGSWAKLIGLEGANRTNAWLNKNFFKFGKVGDSCDLSLDELHSDPTLKLDKKISKIHFVISKIDIRGKTVAQIKDVSLNGTLINDENIGRGNIRILGHDDWIGVRVTGVNIKLWRFAYLWMDEPTNQIPKTVRMDYLLIDRIGEGRFCKVYYVLNKKTCRHFAMKYAKVSLDINDDDGALNEARILKSIMHENIITYHETILIDSDLSLIVEFLNGENLSTILRRKGRLSESYTKNIAQQILYGLAYLHGLKIAHRNIRPKNILLNANENDPTAKISNFKLSKVLRKGVSTVKNFGMSVYDAPETKIVEPGKGKFDMRVDIWSFGVLLYVCLCGREPLEGGENRAPGTIFFSPKDVWSQVSELAKTCVQACLVPNYENRIQAKYLLFQPWFILNFKSNVKSYTKRPNILKSESTPKRYKSSEHE